MKRSIMLVAITTIMYFLTSCSKDPKAGFTYDANDLVAQTKIKFTNTSTDANKYEWDFGDGSDVVDDINPTYAYEKSGNYTVTLTAVGDNGTNTYSESLKISRPVSIYPGEALGNFKLGEEWSSVKTKLEDGYEHDAIYWADYDIYAHYIYTADKNMEIEMFGSSMDQSSDDRIVTIYAHNDFDGETEKGIGLGDDFTGLKSIYGTPDAKDGWSADGYNSYDYDALGISFIKESSGSTILDIIIYPPTDSESAILNSKHNIPIKVLKDRLKAHINK